MTLKSQKSTQTSAMTTHPLAAAITRLLRKDKNGLYSCVFCGGRAAWKLSKTRYCQLHGDPYQDVIVFCDHQKPNYSNESNAKRTNCGVRPEVSAGDMERAFELWNTRSYHAYPVLTHEHHQ